MKRFLAIENKYDFSPKIIARGKSYYQDGNVVEVNRVKTVYGYKYYAKVKSSSYYELYHITIEDHMSFLVYRCDCPCDYPCKHEYATLLAIDNNEINDLDLLEEIEPIKFKLENVIKEIDGEDLKVYLINKLNKNEDPFNNLKDFKNKFYNYLSKQSEEYYYNNLYNLFKIDFPTYNLLSSYIYDLLNATKHHDYNQGFIIIKSIINAYYHAKEESLKNEDLELFNILCEELKIIYQELKDKDTFNNWFKDLIKVNYYNDLNLKYMFSFI